MARNQVPKEAMRRVSDQLECRDVNTSELRNELNKVKDGKLPENPQLFGAGTAHRAGSFL